MKPNKIVPAFILTAAVVIPAIAQTGGNPFDAPQTNGGSAKTADPGRQRGFLDENTPKRRAGGFQRARILSNRSLQVVRGDVSILPELRAEVAAKRPGVLKSVQPNRMGSMVSPKQVIARIDDEAAQKTLEIATEKEKDEVERKYAESVKAIATEVLKRYYDANKRAAAKGRTKVFNTSQLEEKKLEVERSELQIKKAIRDRKIAGMEVDQAKIELKTYAIEAPIGGIVTDIKKQAGESVALGDTIMEITDYSRMQVTGMIPVRYRNYIQVGGSVDIQIAISDQDEGEKQLDIEKMVFKGSIYHVKQEVDRGLQEFQVFVEVQNQQDARGILILQSGMNVNLTIPPPSASRATRLRQGSQR